MSTTLKFLAVLVSFCFVASPALGYVVVEDLDRGQAALNSTSVSALDVDNKATGEIDDLQPGEITGDLSFNPPVGNSANSRDSSRGRSAGNQLLRYPAGNSSSGGNAGSGGGGAGGGGNSGVRRGGSPGGNGREVVQAVVVVSEINAPNAKKVGNLGVDVTLLDGGQDVAGAGGAPSSPGGSAGGGGTAGVGGGPNAGGGSGKVVTGTPEPTALVVWTVAACCGYGVFRLRRK